MAQVWDTHLREPHPTEKLQRSFCSIALPIGDTELAKIDGKSINEIQRTRQILDFWRGDPGLPKEALDNNAAHQLLIGAP